MRVSNGRRSFVGITDAELQKSPFDLSGGQKRRAAIAGVIAMEPDVLILDEPTAGLDPRGRESILQNIRDYQAAQHAAVVMVSHSMEEIASNVDRLLVMNHGQQRHERDAGRGLLPRGGAGGDGSRHPEDDAAVPAR